MVEDDVQLINKVLAGDDEAFTALVRKHQKSVHALAWRKIGDFHAAEEITQDTFLRVYKHLSKLKDPNQFSGWLYVTTARLCNTWLRKNKSLMESLEEIPMAEVEKAFYEQYVSTQHEEESHSHHQELVKKLLEKLPESERTVMTLYYLGEMTTKEISKFLGVSVNTITSRLQRARKRLKQDEELLVQEMLGSVQLSESLTQNIVRKVADMKPVSPSAGKPFLPWIGFGAVAILVVMFLLGVSNQYLVRFQKPYSFEAQSEPTVEIIDTPVILNIDAKPAVRNQAGHAVTTRNSRGTGVQISESDVASHAEVGVIQLSTSQWAQIAGPQGGPVFDIFATDAGTIYTLSPTGIYRLSPDTPPWTLVNSSLPIEGSWMPMAAHEGTLYIVFKDTVFASTDDGETWEALCSRPGGHAIELVIVNEAQNSSSREHSTMYLALRDKGVFRSTDIGGQWVLLDDGLMGGTISAMVVVGDRVFAGTDKGLYRLDSGTWQRLLEDVPGSVHSLVAAEGSLYVGTGPDFRDLKQIGSEPTEVMHQMYDDNSGLGRAFHSSDLGASWTEITPIGGSRPVIAPSGMDLLVAGKTILAQTFTRFQSKDGGQTWTDLGFDRDSIMRSSFPSVAMNENTFYKAGKFGVHRTTDGGKSWHLFMDGMMGTRVLNLVALHNRLYAHTGDALVQSADGDGSWKTVGIDIIFSHSRLTVAGNILYVISPEKDNLGIFRLSADDDGFVPVQRVPTLVVDTPSIKMSANNKNIGQAHLSQGRPGDEDNLVGTLRHREHVKVGAFAVSGDTFYAEYKRKLFIRHPGDTAWTDTGLVDTGTPPDGTLDKGFKLAISGDTIYVGKRDGKLFQSLDDGNSWKDITSSLPFPFTAFTEIVFSGSTVYVATDTGVLASQTGSHWRVVTDAVRIDKFTVDGATLYGAADTGIYSLGADGEWKQVAPGVPGKVLSLVVHRDRLYVATQQRGMFHISLAEKGDAVSRK